MQVPWEDLCYLFGEIMYGGHITDDWDRRLCKTYLQEVMHPKMVSRRVLAAMWIEISTTQPLFLGRISHKSSSVDCVSSANQEVCVTFAQVKSALWGCKPLLQ